MEPTSLADVWALFLGPYFVSCHAPSQVRLLAGDLASSLNAEGGKPTKMAEAAVEILETSLVSCREKMEQERERT